MRILLDECLPRQLRRELPGHEVRTVPEVGWASIKNGALLPLVGANYDLFITIDQRLEREHRLPPRLAIITLLARTNGLESLLPLAPAIRDAISRIAPGDRIRIGRRQRR